MGYVVHQKGYRCYNPGTCHTYVTMDVTFLESEMFFSFAASNSPLQGETLNKEVNWLQLDWPGFNDVNIEPQREMESQRANVSASPLIILESDTQSTEPFEATPPTLQ